ncbi:hypothetical protein KFU94_68945 [Chloroflexi bacterium TSY]|nr:hypothetical protein [Chloroflexi bacterium TSY]
MAHIIIFGIGLWLGAYLIARSSQNRSVLWIGIGLILYALVTALQLLSNQAYSSETQRLLDNLGSYLLLIPGLFWLFALATLGPADQPWRERLEQMRQSSRRWIGLILAASILLGLTFGLIIARLNWIPPSWLIFSIGADLCVLGFAIARLDAFDLGEALLPDFLRSLDATLLALLLFAGPVVIAMQFIASESLTMWMLLLTITTFSIFFQTFREPVEAVLDRVAFGTSSYIPQQRAELRAAAEALPKIETKEAPESFDDAEFTRLTRRALSHYGDLNRLAASPLTQLTLVEKGLAEQGLDVNTLTRATELKRLLTEAINHLKPDEENGFKSTDEWRYYNALYFPYVSGLRPYSRRAAHTDLDAPARAVLE